MSISIPVLMPFAWASVAGTNKGLVVATSTTSAAPNNASLPDGFPIQQMSPAGSAPNGGDMNGILNWITSFQTWVNAGGLFPYNSTLSSAIGGYPLGTLLVSSSLNQAYFCNNATPVNPNTNNPDSSLSGWQYAFGNIVGTAASVGGSSSTDGTMYWSGTQGLCLQGKGSSNQFSLMTPSATTALMQMRSGVLYFPFAPVFSQKMSLVPYTNTTPVANDVWIDSTQGTLCLEGGSGSNKVTLYTASTLSVLSGGFYFAAIGATGGAVDLLVPSGMTNTTTFPAGFFVNGRTIKLEMNLILALNTGCTIQLLPTIGAGGGCVLDYTAASAANYYSKLEMTFQCGSQGSSGTAFMFGTLTTVTGGSGVATVYYAASGGSPMTFNTTIANLLDVQVATSVSYSGTVYVNSATITVFG